MRLLALRKYPQHEFIGVHSYEKADFYLRNIVIDLVIADFQLGGKKSGVDIFYDHHRTNKNFVLFTGTRNKKAFDFIRKENIIHLKKPFQIDDLWNIIKKIQGENL